MASWFAAINGQQYGPVTLDVLQQWVREGRVGPAHLVWCEGWADWKPSSQVPELNEVLAAAPPPAPVPPAGLVPAPMPGGTGGATPNSELTRQARDLLRGNWGKPMLFSFLVSLLCIAGQRIPRIGGLISLALGGAWAVSGAVFFLTFTRSGTYEVGMMFAGFKLFGKALAANLLMTLFILLWALLLIVPGIIASIAYSQTFYLLAQDPTLGSLEAIRRSRDLMRGHKWRYFCLGFRFLGWVLLCVLTLGIGFLWLAPYARMTYARFFDDLQPPALVPATAMA